MIKHRSMVYVVLCSLECLYVPELKIWSKADMFLSKDNIFIRKHNIIWHCEGETMNCAATNRGWLWRTVSWIQLIVLSIRDVHKSRTNRLHKRKISKCVTRSFASGKISTRQYPRINRHFELGWPFIFPVWLPLFDKIWDILVKFFHVS